MQTRGSLAAYLVASYRSFVWVGFAAAIGFAASGCTKPVVVYTSLNKELIAELDPIIRAHCPKVELQWFQESSEKVISKVNEELAADEPKADLVLTTDPFWYQELKEKGYLLPYNSPAAKGVPAQAPTQFKDPDHHFAAVRVSTILIAYHPEVFKPNELPERFRDLTKPQYKGKVSMQSPMESGVGFTTTAALSRVLGWDYFKELKKNGLVASGGNGAVVGRIETRERPIGILPLENVLRAQAQGLQIRPIYPLDGAIPVPGPIAILKTAKYPDAARKVYDAFFSPQAQNVITRSGVYSPIPQIVSPEGARIWGDLLRQLMPWDSNILAETHRRHDEILARFSETVLK